MKTGRGGHVTAGSVRLLVTIMWGRELGEVRGWEKKEVQRCVGIDNQDLLLRMYYLDI